MKEMETYKDRAGCMKKAFENLESRNMLEAGDVVAAGVSGGADSVCLLLVLKAYAESHPEKKLQIKAVHVEHGIRGEESLEDARFVKALCEQWEIPLTVVSEDVREKARREHLTVEEAGRQVRYQAFEEVAGPGGKIAVAHNAGDQAETILWNLARGSGIAGLCGMRKVRGKILRPLMNVPRREIEVFLRENGVSWRTDSTNLTLEYTRNKIRSQAVPALESVNARAVEHLGALGERMDKVYVYLLGKGEEWLLNHSCIQTEKMEISFPAEAFLRLEEVEQDFVLQAVLEKLGSGRKDLTAVHLAGMKALAASQSGKKLSNLPGNLEASRDGSWYRLYEKPKQEKSAQEARQVMDEAELPVPGEVRYGRWMAAARSFPMPESGFAEVEKIFRKNEYTKWLDYDTIDDTIRLRSRRAGDYLTIAPGCRRKKLKQYFIDEKIPKEERDKIPLIASGSHILLAGQRMSEACKITDQTKRILEIQIWEEENHGR